jgi:hypothetical protein
MGLRCLGQAVKGEADDDSGQHQTVRRKNPPQFECLSTLIQTGAGSKKIARLETNLTCCELDADTALFGQGIPAALE